MRLKGRKRKEQQKVTACERDESMMHACFHWQPGTLGLLTVPEHHGRRLRIRGIEAVRTI